MQNCFIYIHLFYRRALDIPCKSRKHHPQLGLGCTHKWKLEKPIVAIFHQLGEHDGQAPWVRLVDNVTLQ